MFQINQTRYYLRNDILLVQPKYKKVMYGYKTLIYYGSHLWNKLPRNDRNITVDISFSAYKTLMNKWDGPNCNCSSY